MSHAKFVILSQPRTGSSLTCSLLSSHKGVRCLIEPINPITHSHHMRPMPDDSTCLIPEELVQNNINEALDIILSKQPPPDEWVLSSRVASLAAGFKIMAHQIQSLKSEEMFWTYLHRYNIKALLIVRDNIAMQYVSDLITKVTREPTCWIGTPKIAKVEVPISTLGENLLRIRRERRYLLDKSKLLDRRILTYEQFKDTVEPMEKIFHWITGKTSSLITKLQKQNPDSLKSRVLNYEDLADELKRLGYPGLLEFFG